MASTANAVVEFEGGIAPLTTERTLEEISADIQECKFRISVSSIDLGGFLKEAKAAVKRNGYSGGWEKWVEEQAGIHRATADRYIKVHTSFRGKAARIRAGLETLSFEVLSLMAQPSMPSEVVEIVEGMVEKGDSVTIKEIKELKDNLKDAEKGDKEKLDKQKEKARQYHASYKGVCDDLEKIRAENSRLRDTITILKHDLGEAKTVEASAIDITPEQPQHEVVDDVGQEPGITARLETNDKFSEGLALFATALDLYDKGLWDDFIAACDDLRLEKQGSLKA